MPRPYLRHFAPVQLPYSVQRWLIARGLVAQGLSKRIMELFEALDQVQKGTTQHVEPWHAAGGNGSGNGSYVSSGDGNGGLPETAFQLSVQGLCYSTPDYKRQLARNLTFVVSEGMGVVIRGPSGCGKSSLIRCIAGLWTADAGKIVRPDFIGRDGIVFMPQRPYMALGSLRQQIIYPFIETDVSKDADDFIVSLLVDFGAHPSVQPRGQRSSFVEMPVELHALVLLHLSNCMRSSCLICIALLPHVSASVAMLSQCKAH